MKVLKRETVNRVIPLRAAADDRPVWGARSLELQNLDVLDRTSRRTAKAARAPLPAWLVETVLRSRRDPVGEGRGIVARRILRRHHPDLALDLSRRMAPPTRHLEARMRILLREGAALARDVEFDGVLLPRGTPVDELGQTRGTVFVGLPDYSMAIDVALADMRAMTPADHERLRERPVGYGQLPSRDGGVPAP